MSTAARHFHDSYDETLELRDGSKVRLRLVRPTDKALLLEGFKRMSSESRFLRFFGHKSGLTTRELTYLTELDGERHFALGAAEVAADGTETGVGIARFVRLPDEDAVAEPALAVVDDWQGRGLGREMLIRLSAAARERGVERFRCFVLADNPAMLHVIRDLDPAALSGEEQGLVLVDLELPQRPWDPEARRRPRGRALHGFLAMAAEGLLRLRRAFAWLDTPDDQDDAER
ncbi:MAG: N-acetyltransferase [Deltaproteobacteria bacterium]|jgi:GNAT superfamily N-acetyltransferase|nr:N-acetyltransferase [Deltaproteobacteria bacterium]MBW2530630.1 N-acetyltransferase [Deltaproteobacteria bacterium]